MNEEYNREGLESYVTSERSGGRNISRVDILRASGFVLDSIQTTHDFIDGHNLVEEFEPITDIDKKAMIITCFDDHFGELIVREDALTGERVVTYDFNIAEERMDYRFDRAFQEIANQGKENFDEIIIAIGGDNVDGDGSVFPGQGHFTDLVDGISGQIRRYSLSIVSNAERAALFMGDGTPIRIVGVVGNHGNSKASRNNHPVKHNWDRGCYDWIDAWLKHKWAPDITKNITMIYSKNIDKKVFEVKGWRYLMIHATSKTLTTPTAYKNMLGLKELYDMHVVLTGHFHDSAYASLGTTKLFRIGTAAGPNEYSDKLMIASGGPEQSLFIVTKEQRVAAHIIIDLSGVGNYNEEGSVHV